MVQKTCAKCCPLPAVYHTWHGTQSILNSVVSENVVEGSDGAQHVFITLSSGQRLKCGRTLVSTRMLGES